MKVFVDCAHCGVGMQNSYALCKFALSIIKIILLFTN